MPRDIDVCSESEEDDIFLDQVAEWEKSLSPQRPPPSTPSSQLAPMPASPTVAAVKLRRPTPAADRRQAMVPVIDLTGDTSSDSFCALPPPPPPAKRPRLGGTPTVSKKGKEAAREPVAKLDLDDDLSCSVCMELLLGPLLLSCGHAFCSHCLTACLSTNPDTCPTCRQQGGTPYRALALEGVVEKVFEHQMKELAASGQVIQANATRHERRARLKALEVARMAETEAANRARAQSASMARTHYQRGRTIDFNLMPRIAAWWDYDMEWPTLG